VLSLEVLDDGPGAEMADVAISSGSGLRMAHQRLVARYGDKARFHLQTFPGKGFSVRVEIPANDSATFYDEFTTPN
ncbi:MAG: hypothetical protein ACREDR_27065, partial [Blastocatellia bacterium]